MGAECHFEPGVLESPAGYKVMVHDWPGKEKAVVRMMGERSEARKANIRSSQSDARIKAVRARRRQAWRREEQAKLGELVQEFGTNWAKIAPHFPKRSIESVRNHWRRQLPAAQ